MWPFRRSKAADALVVKHASYIYGLGGARWMGRRFETMAREGFEQNPVVNACVTKKARSASSVDLFLYRKQGGTLVKLEQHPLLDLLARPNPTTGGRRFLESVFTSKLIGGNAYVHGTGIQPRSQRPPKELWLLPTQAMEVRTQARSFLPAYFEYKPGGSDAQRFDVDPITGRSAICHLKTVNPLDPSVGLPPLIAAARAADIFNAGQEWNQALLQNDARPSGGLEFVDGDGKPVALTDEQRSSVKQMLDERFSGAGNAGRPIVMEGGMKWVQMALSPKDMEHRESMVLTARFIAAVYQTPPQLVNIPGESTYSNYGEAKVAYYSDTVLPFLESNLEDLNNWLPPLYGDDLFIWYDEEAVPALEPRRKEKAERINASTYLTIDEKRLAMGYDALPGGIGNVVLVSSTSIPLDLAGGTDLPEPGSPADEATPEPTNEPDEDDEDDEDDEE